MRRPQLTWQASLPLACPRGARLEASRGSKTTLPASVRPACAQPVSASTRVAQAPSALGERVLDPGRPRVDDPPLEHARLLELGESRDERPGRDLAERLAELVEAHAPACDAQTIASIERRPRRSEACPDLLGQRRAAPTAIRSRHGTARAPARGPRRGSSPDGSSSRRGRPPARRRGRRGCAPA